MAGAAKKSKSQKRPVEVIVFEDPEKPKKKTLDDSATTNKKKLKVEAPLQPPVFDQRMAMYDIRKLAMTGMHQEDKEEAMVNYLVELGAKRPKGKAIPMKDYIDELKRRKSGGESSGDGIDKSNKKQKRKKRDKKDIFIDGQIGKWKKGVQFVKNPGKKFQTGL